MRKVGAVLEVHKFFRRRAALSYNASKGANHDFSMIRNDHGEAFIFRFFDVLYVTAFLAVPRKSGGYQFAVYFTKRKRLKQRQVPEFECEASRLALAPRSTTLVLHEDSRMPLLQSCLGSLRRSLNTGKPTSRLLAKEILLPRVVEIVS